MIARVLISLPIDRGFDFTVPESLVPQAVIGKRVIVRFNDKEHEGIIAELLDASDHPGPLEPVLRVSEAPSFSEDALEFCVNTAEHYLCPAGLFINRILPRTVTRSTERYLAISGDLEKTTSAIEARVRRAPRQAALLRFLLAQRSPYPESQLRDRLGTSRSVADRLIELGLICEVTQASDNASPQVGRHRSKERPANADRMLIFGQSRMPEYLRIIDETLFEGKDVLFLAPEILLARQIQRALLQDLHVPADVYHSNLPEGERGKLWEEIRITAGHGQPRVVVGTRSALFLPFASLGLIIVDEEQDRSYKQDEMLPHYHARDVATARDSVHVVYGSPAPSLESFHLALSGKVNLVRSPDSGRAIRTSIIDTTREKALLSDALLDGIDRTLSAGKRALVGVNARGHFQAVLCKKCGHPLRCPRCGINLTYDVKTAQLVCRVCGTAQSRLACPRCGARSLRFVGTGSERVEEALRSRFPSARYARVEGAALANRSRWKKAESALAGAADIIVGTPVIAKGGPLPNVGFAAAIGVDGILARPDFRATERAYQYLTGLLGRVENGGEAIVQTNYPDHPAIVTAIAGDYDRFYALESAEREALFYPPFSHLARLLAARKRWQSKTRLEKLLGKYDLQIIGPVAHPVRTGLDVALLKGKDPAVVRAACECVLAEIPGLEIDIDPERI
jgi:primosomal protein N' (replication factor Y) (superfamily II helicase)